LFKQALHEGVTSGIVVFASECRMQVISMRIAAGCQFEQVVAAGADQLGHFLVAGARLGDQCVELLIAAIAAACMFVGQFGQRLAIAAQQLPAIGGTGTECIDALVVPACQHVLRAVGNGQDVNADVVLLTDTVEAADVVDTDMQYLYSDGDFFHFMVPDTYEQLTASKQAVGEGAQWLKDGTICVVTLWNGVPLVVTPPAHMELKVIETDPGVRGDTATGGSKPAKLETGAMVRVPLFINEGEILRIDTRTGEYLSRGKG